MVFHTHHGIRQSCYLLLELLCKQSLWMGQFRHVHFLHCSMFPHQTTYTFQRRDQVKDLTKSLVLKRDNGCILCNSKAEALPGSANTRGHDGGEYSDTQIGYTSTPLEPNGLDVHHEHGVYGNKQAHVPLQNWPWRNFKQQMVVLCDSHHARRTQGNHYSEIRDIRRYLLNLYPDYYSQFDVLGGI